MGRELDDITKRRTEWRALGYTYEYESADLDIILDALLLLPSAVRAIQVTQAEHARAIQDLRDRTAAMVRLRDGEPAHP